MTIHFYFYSAVGVAALDDCIYVCGGYDGVTSLNTVECYCPKTDIWKTVSVYVLISKMYLKNFFF